MKLFIKEDINYIRLYYKLWATRTPLRSKLKWIRLHTILEKLSMPPFLSMLQSSITAQRLSFILRDMKSHSSDQIMATKTFLTAKTH